MLLEKRGIVQMEGILFVAIILGIQIVYVSFFTIRMIFTLKGKRYLAAGISAIEVYIYIMGLSLVLDRLDNPINLLAYSLGYGLGVLTGTKIEERLALGYVTVQVITEHIDGTLPDAIRAKGFGVTSWFAKGKDGDRLVLYVLTKRKHQNRLFTAIKELDPKAFYMQHEPNYFHGGFWTKKVL